MSFVKGMRTGLYVSEPAAFGEAAALAPTQFIARHYLAMGATNMYVRKMAGSPVVIPAGSIIETASVRFLVTADTEVVAGADRQMLVSSLDGMGGIPISLALGAVLTWDGLMRVSGTSSSELRIGESTQEHTSVVYDTTGGPLPWAESEVTSKNWALDRGGNFQPTDHAYQAVERAALEGREVFVRRVLPDENGDPVKAQEGRAHVTDFRTPAPADGIITASWEFRGQGRLTVAPYPPALVPPGVMLDFQEEHNAINFMFA